MHELGDSIKGKTVVDVTNALTQKMQLALGFQPAAPKSCKRKCLRGMSSRPSTPFLPSIWTRGARGQQLTIFAASDSEQARNTVWSWDEGSVSTNGRGPLRNARQLEALGYFNIQLDTCWGTGLILVQICSLNGGTRFSDLPDVRVCATRWLASLCLRFATPALPRL